MNHSFDVELAKLYGVDAAIMIENFRFWIAKNKANGRHFYDGRWWTYNSVKAFSELFPYWSAPQIRRILDRLEERGVLIAGCYNQTPYDRTKWYSLSDQVDLTNSANGNAESSKTLDRTDTKTDSKQAARKRAHPCPDGVDAQVWEDWLELRKSKRAAVTDTVIQAAAQEAAKARMSLTEFLREWCVRGSQGLKAEWLTPNRPLTGQQPINTAERNAKAKRLLGINTGDVLDA